MGACSTSIGSSRPGKGCHVNLIGIRGSPLLIALVGIVLISIALVRGRLEVGVIGVVVLAIGALRLVLGWGG